ncbi:MAG: glycosyltransferase [Candidatus Altiarchaeota archaeon]|nr:glycosyltransferase [Candidatus Altiarchaeota archaeon]
MKIAQVTKYFFPHRGGIETHVLGICKEFLEKGHEVDVYTSNKPKSREREDICGIKVFRSRVFFTLFNAPFSPGIFINLMRWKYDIIHVHLPDPFNSVFALLAAKARSKPLFVTYHADIIKDNWYHTPFRLIYGLFLDGVLSAAVKIAATTPNYVNKSQISARYRKKVEIVPNFVDAARFNQSVDGSVLRERHGLGDRKVILFLGRLVPYKGVEYLIKAFAKVKERRDDAVLVIAGSGPLEKELKDLAEESGIKDVLFVKASDEDIPGYYAACDVFVLPSVTRQEAFGIALLEAMASGKPAVTTNISGMPYVIGDAGITVKPRDVDGLSHALVEILADEQLAKNLGEKGRARVVKEFSQKKVAEKILELYGMP